MLKTTEMAPGPTGFCCPQSSLRSLAEDSPPLLGDQDPWMLKNQSVKKMQGFCTCLIHLLEASSLS